MNNIWLSARAWLPLGLWLGMLCVFPSHSDQPSNVLVGRATRVVDGDTVDVLLHSGKIRVRLHAVDAPEKSQPHGKEATAALSKWVLGKDVEIEPFEQDRYDRVVGIIYVGDQNVNSELVRGGHAWAYRRYMKKADAELCSIEATARSVAKGLWSLPKADRIAPWEYRQRKKRESFTDYFGETAARCVAAIGRTPRPSGT